MELQGPVLGFAIGLLLILLRDKVASVIENGLKSFQFSQRYLSNHRIKGAYVGVIGAMYCFVALFEFGASMF